MSVTPADYLYVQQVVREQASIILSATQQYLVDQRLLPVARAEGLSSVDEFIRKTKSDSSGRLRKLLVEALCTNETSFFRDQNVYDALKASVIPDLIRARSQSRTLRIWSAACSTGQEPYTLAIMLRRDFPLLATWDIKIYATDLSGAVVAQARSGRYSANEVRRGLSPDVLASAFTQVGDEYELKKEYRSLVSFSELNLTAAWPIAEPIDLIMIRNVLIYFSAEVKRDILTRACKKLRADGCLFLGTTETPAAGLEDLMPVWLKDVIAYRHRHPQAQPTRSGP